MRERDTPPTRPRGLELFERLEQTILDALPSLEPEALPAAHEALRVIRDCAAQRYPAEFGSEEEELEV